MESTLTADTTTATLVDALYRLESAVYYLESRDLKLYNSDAVALLTALVDLLKAELSVKCQLDRLRGLDY